MFILASRTRTYTFIKVVLLLSHQYYAIASADQRACNRASYTGECDPPACPKANHYFDLACFCEPCPTDLQATSCLAILGLCPHHSSDSLYKSQSGQDRLPDAGLIIVDKKLASPGGPSDIGVPAKIAISSAVLVLVGIIVVAVFLVLKGRNNERRRRRSRHAASSEPESQPLQLPHSLLITPNQDESARLDIVNHPAPVEPLLDFDDPLNRCPQPNSIPVSDDVGQFDV